MADKLPKSNLDDWLIKRKRTTQMCYLQNLALGMEYALTFLTLYIYLKDVIKTKYVNTFYSIISAIYVMSQVLMSLVMSNLFGQYRNLRTMFFMSNSLVAIGNLLYTIPLSAWLLLAGRLISGAGGSIRPIMTSELSRSYPADKLLPYLSAMGISFGLGFVLGPAINLAFVKANFQFLGIHIGFANGSGLILTILFILMIIASAFGVSNLSQEYDLKQERLLQNEDEDDQEIEHNLWSAIFIVKKLASHVDTALILFYSALMMYTAASFDNWLPMACINYQHCGILKLNIITLGTGIAELSIIFVVLFKPPSDRLLVYLAALSLLSIVWVQGTFLVFESFKLNVYVIDTLWVLWVIAFGMIFLLEEIFCISTMSRMVHSNVQAFAESVRLSFSRVGGVLGLLISPFTFDFMQYIGFVNIGIVCIGTFSLLWRRKYFQNPQIIIKLVGKK